MPLYTLLFNVILETGIMPSKWVEGVVIPIFKNKGDPLSVDNFRPITLLSCIGKLFTAVLNNRLNAYLEEYNLLNENQAGFRSGYSTTDHIFSLKCIIDLLRAQKKKIFCSFIDFSKAFDSVWRVGLWRKILESNINGRFFTVIKNMYANIKSCISINNEKSNFFGCHRGVRQGENLSPVLFALYLNDLEDYLFQKRNPGVTIDINNEECVMVLTLIILMYADDTIILAENADSLQKSLIDFADYCRQWKLNINVNKSKVLIFGFRGNTNNSFYIDTEQLEIVDSYKYLGTFFAKSGSFLTARKHVAEQARKVLFLLYSRINNLNLPVDLQLKLFDHTVLPIMTYSCEVFGFENIQILERIHNEFLRKITKTKKSTPLFMLYAELGRYPIEIIIKSRMISFWNRIITGKQSKYSYQLYQAVRFAIPQKSKWLYCIRNILTETGRFDLWLNQDYIQSRNVGRLIKQVLIDQNLQKWHACLQESSKGLNYKLFKQSIELEQYFLILPRKFYIPLVKFRTTNHFFPVETGRWQGVDLAERKCELCTANDICDEFHLLLVCSYFSEPRKKYIKQYYYTRANVLKFREILSTTNENQLTKLCQFIGILLRHFSNDRR